MTKILRAVCLNSVDYRDNDRLLILLSAEQGKTVARIRSVKSPKSKLKAAGAEVIEQFFGTWTSPDKNLAAGAVTEVLEKFTRENVPAENEFTAGLNALFKINYAEGTPYIHTLRFLIGFMPLIGLDLSDAELSRHARALFNAVSNADEDELDCLEYEVGDVVFGIAEAGRIISAFSGEKFKTLSAFASFTR